ncbi:WSC-domain-containing protein [Aureobasidium pullulans]|uniref:WSC-domain-containing protein n=1 Tax=Aureobasidium pullulans TaxID=5580 RepID=A0A4S9BRW8_AURPU|nr:WSC-domain-containing protein [Aureobasidium pullulans]
MQLVKEKEKVKSLFPFCIHHPPVRAFLLSLQFVSARLQLSSRIWNRRSSNHSLFTMLASTIISALSLFAVASAQSSTASASSASASATSAVAASIAAGSNGYSYVGCWNETTGIEGTAGARALSGGKMESVDTATVEACLEYCGASNYQYAGLEYAQECWCSNYISSLSTQLEESNCSLACKGNDTELCGGYLTITLYNLTSKKSGSSGSSSKTGAASTAASSWTYVLGAGVMALTLGTAL